MLLNIYSGFVFNCIARTWADTLRLAAVGLVYEGTGLQNANTKIVSCWRYENPGDHSRAVLTQRALAVVKDS